MTIIPKAEINVKRKRPKKVTDPEESQRKCGEPGETTESAGRDDPRDYVFHVSTAQDAFCPFCGVVMKLDSTKLRRCDLLVFPEGTRETSWGLWELNSVDSEDPVRPDTPLCVARLTFAVSVYRCPECGKYHRALPSFMYPGILCGARLFLDRARERLPGDVTVYGTGEAYVPDERDAARARRILEDDEDLCVSVCSDRGDDPEETLETRVIDVLRDAYVIDGKRLARVRHGRTDWPGTKDLFLKYIRIFSRLPRLPSYYRTAGA